MPSAEDRWNSGGRFAVVDQEGYAEIFPRPRAVWNFGWAYLFPWGSPIVVHVVNDGHEMAEMAAIFAWPMIFLFVGLYIGTLRGNAVMRRTDRKQAKEIGAHLSWYANLHAFGVVFLALFEAAAGICLTVDSLGWAATAYAIVTLALYAPFCLLTWRAELRLKQAHYLACQD